MSIGEEYEDNDLGEFAAKVILADPEFTKTQADLASLKKHEGTFFENLDPYIRLQRDGLCGGLANKVEARKECLSAQVTLEDGRRGCQEVVHLPP